jgi:hypothetical protein
MPAMWFLATNLPDHKIGVSECALVTNNQHTLLLDSLTESISMPTFHANLAPLREHHLQSAYMQARAGVAGTNRASSSGTRM